MLLPRGPQFYSRRAEVLAHLFDEQPHLEMQNSKIQLVWALDEQRITAQSWLVGMGRRHGLVHADPNVLANLYKDDVTVFVAAHGGRGHTLGRGRDVC